MNSRGFAILLLIAVAASVACGLIVERYTAPGMERTVWFAIGLAAILFPAGRFAERRGWVHGVWQARGKPAQATADASTPATPEASATVAVAAAPESPVTPGSGAAPATRPSSGEPK